MRVTLRHGGHAIRLAGFILIGLAILFATACAAPPSRPPHAGEFIGSYEEAIGPQGPITAGFSDADFVQLLLPDDIPPIYDPQFVPAAAVRLPDDELVIGSSVNGDARAYPAGILYTREMVNDVVGGVPVLVTWCPRCYTALVHDRRVNGTTAVFGNQGALYQGAMTWFDHETGSIWSQPLGKALVGPRFGATLSLMPSQLTTWREWVKAHPDTAVLTVAHPSPPFRGRQPGQDHVVGVIVSDVAAAWPYPWLAAGNVVNATVGETPISIWRDPSSGAIRASDLNRPGREPRSDIPVIIAWRSAWLKFYPDSIAKPPATKR